MDLVSGPFDYEWGKDPPRIKRGRLYSGGGLRVLHIVFSYFEMIGHYLEGNNSTNRSEKLFNHGFVMFLSQRSNFFAHCTKVCDADYTTPG